MTNAELLAKIKAEIERLKAKYRKDMYKSNHEGLASGYKIEAYNELLSFLSTLESEKPIIPNDLKEASKEYCPDDAYPFGPDIINNEVRKAFIAGYNICKEQTEKRWLEDRDGCFWDGVEEGKKAMKEQDEKELSDLLTIAHLQGADQMKEQMLKEAVEGYVTLTMTGIPTVAATIKEGDNIGVGDKVRVIVLPKEDKK